MIEIVDLEEILDNPRPNTKDGKFRYDVVGVLMQPDLDITALKGLIARYEMGRNVKKIHVPSEILVKLAADVLNVTPSNIYSKVRKRDYVIARSFVTEVLYGQKWRYQAIGDLFNVDHSSSINGRKALKSLIDTKDIVYFPLWQEFLYLVDIYKHGETDNLN